LEKDQIVDENSETGSETYENRAASASQLTRSRLMGKSAAFTPIRVGEILPLVK